MISSCKKYLTIDEVQGRFLVGQVFSTDSAANTAVAGIYRKWKDLYNSASSLTILCGLSADELEVHSSSPQYIQYYTNEIASNNPMLPWGDLYNIIYQANACIESLEKSEISEKRKNYYMGEVKFIRAHCYFNLVNLFGDVPLLLTTDLKKNSTASRDAAAVVYEQILADLNDAEVLMEDGIFPTAIKERINSSIVKAFLARIHLYLGDWVEAKTLSTSVIQSGKYSLETNLDSAFTEGSREAIFQFSDNPLDGNFEALAFAPTADPNISMTPSLIEVFEANDLRKQNWASLKGEIFYPNKYKSRQTGDQELYTLFRLAEQFLIRAEANVHLNLITEAAEDISLLRTRAGLSVLNDNISEDSCLAEVIKERRAELFAETGHRWFDLKRTGRIDSVIASEKGNLWMSFDSLYPIPRIDIQRNPNLDQNPNYN